MKWNERSGTERIVIRGWIGLCVLLIIMMMILGG